MTCRVGRLALAALVAAGTTGCEIVERPELDASGFPVARGEVAPPKLRHPLALDTIPARSAAAQESPEPAPEDDGGRATK